MGVSRALIDAVNCPKNVIDKHLGNSGIDYANYHRDAYQLFIVDNESVSAALSAIDAFFDSHADVLHTLNYDDSQAGDVVVQLCLQIEFDRSTPIGDITIPKRLSDNLRHTGISIQFE